jgi:hypothetical protein
MTLRWPEELPAPQVESLRTVCAPYSEPIDVLMGPTRTRLRARNAQPTYEFEVWMSADDTQFFEEWYQTVVEEHDGEMYLPWIGGGKVVAFADEYQQSPIGKGWRLSAMVVVTRIDETLCYEHISEVFGDIYRDDGESPDLYFPVDGATEIYFPDYPLSLVYEEPC